jgi:hypothetical protein
MDGTLSVNVQIFVKWCKSFKAWDAFTLECNSVWAVLWVGSDGNAMEFGAFESRVEHVIRSRRVAGHPTSIFFCWMKSRKMKGKNGKTSLMAFP